MEGLDSPTNVAVLANDIFSVNRNGEFCNSKIVSYSVDRNVRVEKTLFVCFF